MSHHFGELEGVNLLDDCNYNLEHSRKESGQKAPWFESYRSFSVFGDILRMLQSQVRGIK